KLVVGGAPIAGAGLASQPTLSRFENAVGRRELIAMGHVLADTVIEHHRRRLKGRATRITIDLDPTDDPTHGQQEFSFFNGHYDTWCYLPVVAAVTFNEETEQFAVAAVLRPGNAPAFGGHEDCCAGCFVSCGPPFRARSSACGWMAASRAPSSSRFSSASRWSTSSRCRAMRGWTSAPGA